MVSFSHARSVLLAMATLSLAVSTGGVALWSVGTMETLGALGFTLVSLLTVAHGHVEGGGSRVVILSSSVLLGSLLGGGLLLDGLDGDLLESGLLLGAVLGGLDLVVNLDGLSLSLLVVGGTCLGMVLSIGLDGAIDADGLLLLVQESLSVFENLLGLLD